MKKKVFIHLGLLLILAGFSMIFVEQVSAGIKRYYADIDKSKQIIKEVDSDYDIFRNTLIDVKESIVDVSKSFNIYLNEFSKKNEVIIEKINTVEEKIESLNEVSYHLIENCSYDLNNYIMNTKCKSFKINYNNMIDSYEEMIGEYNKVLDEYNLYAKKNSKKEVKKYETKLIEYKRIKEEIK